MAVQETIWPKKITVDKRIVEILSGSTYQNFPKALKEIVTNCYDADATNVDITINPEDESIVIEDNGRGMNEEDFDFYFRIAGKTRSKEDYTIEGRKRIGKFGVGFLAVFPFCKHYHIESSKKGSSSIIFADIPCHRYFTKDLKLKDVDEIPIQGGKQSDNSISNKQFTKVKLHGFTEITRAFFNEEYNISGRRNTILKYPPIDRLEWEFAEDLPIRYEENDKLNALLGIDKGIPFNVFLNERKVYRNMYASNILETHENEYESVGRIKFKYFIATDYKTIAPVEGRYLKVRNLNVGVGKRETFGIGLEGRLYARLAHLTGEINVTEGLNDLIKVSRDSFNFSPDYERFQEFFREKLRLWANELDKYAGAEKFEKELNEENKISNIENLSGETLSKQVESLEKRGFKVKKTPSSTQKKQESPENKPESSESSYFKVDKGNKEVFVSEDEFYKSISVNDEKIKIKLAEWSIDEDKPACKLEGDFILINKSYPLFSDKKYVDVFIKIHSILLLEHKKGNLSKEVYNAIQKSILKTFSDYYK